MTLLTLVEPLLAALHGKTLRLPSTLRLTSAEVPRRGEGHRLLPVCLTSCGTASVLPSCGSAMLRGLAAATGLAVIEPTGARGADEVTYPSLPWPT